MAAALTAGLAAMLPIAHAAPESGLGRPGDDAAIIADRLLRAYSNRGSLVAIGDAARKERSVGEGTCPSCLSQAIENLLHHLDWSDADIRRWSSAAIRDRIREETARDFAEARIQPIRGWLLSETEIKLCAIASLAETSLS